jgi:hypothetical protein
MIRDDAVEGHGYSPAPVSARPDLSCHFSDQLPRPACSTRTQGRTAPAGVQQELMYSRSLAGICHHALGLAGTAQFKPPRPLAQPPIRTQRSLIAHTDDQLAVLVIAISVSYLARRQQQAAALNTGKQGSTATEYYRGMANAVVAHSAGAAWLLLQADQIL